MGAKKPVQVAELQLNQGVDCWRRKRKIKALGSEVLGEYDKLAHTVWLLQDCFPKIMQEVSYDVDIRAVTLSLSLSLLKAWLSHIFVFLFVASMCVPCMHALCSYMYVCVCVQARGTMEYLL